MEPNKTNPSALKAIVAVVVVALGGLGLWKLSTTSSDDVVPVQQPSTTDTSNSAPLEQTNPNNTGTTPTTPVTSSGTYKDVTYSATGNYNSPEGGEQVSVSVTLKNGVVTNSTFTGQSSARTSQSYMNRFSSGFSTLVVGKPIDQISLSVVNGSSLTPIGFMNALAKIKAEAKA